MNFMENNFLNIRKTPAVLAILVDLFVLLLIILSSVCRGAKINDSFPDHKMIVLKNKQIYEELSLNFCIYSNENVKILNPLYREIIK